MTTTHNHTIIIAEAGVNHNGDIDIARQLVRAAAAAGADYVKFQTFKAGNLVAAGAQRAEYQKANCGNDESQLQMLRRLELSYDDFHLLKRECALCGIGFMSSPFDLESIDFLASLGQDYWKIPSGEICNLPYLRKIASAGGKVIMSTGMSVVSEISAALSVLEKGGVDRREIALLHCNTQYPTPMADVNLRAMSVLRSMGCGMVGYSDHTQGIEVPVAAVAMGAEIIEKHFTLDKTMSGPDHKASLEPSELAAMVKAVRNIELALGKAEKCVSDSERANKAVARKSIVAAVDILAGEIFTDRNITVKRPGGGISPMMWDDVLGMHAKRDFPRDSLIEL